MIYASPIVETEVPLLKKSSAADRKVTRKKALYVRPTLYASELKKEKSDFYSVQKEVTVIQINLSVSF
ncbi:MAG: hypothetical protein K0S74_1297 [Chlamydiales bacterium]|jgi:hypothetical protein|nr:hypothetical protein [Chlamydiales bacterium]